MQWMTNPNSCWACEIENSFATAHRILLDLIQEKSKWITLVFREHEKLCSPLIIRLISVEHRRICISRVDAWLASSDLCYNSFAAICTMDQTDQCGKLGPRMDLCYSSHLCGNLAAWCWTGIVVTPLLWSFAVGVIDQLDRCGNLDWGHFGWASLIPVGSMQQEKRVRIGCMILFWDQDSGKTDESNETTKVMGWWKRRGGPTCAEDCFRRKLDSHSRSQLESPCFGFRVMVVRSHDDDRKWLDEKATSRAEELMIFKAT